MLHCPATLVITPAAQAAANGSAVCREHRVATVVTPGQGPAGTEGEALAAAHGVPLRVEAGLAGDERAQRGALQSVADEFRGESVLVVVPDGPCRTLQIGDDGWVVAVEPAG